MASNKTRIYTEEVSVLVDGKDVDAARRQGLLSAVGNAVSFGDDLTLAGRYDMLPIRIDADTQHARVVMPKHEQENKHRKLLVTRSDIHG